MADTITPILGLTKPEVAASADTWGQKLNGDLDIIDQLFSAGPVLKLANGGTGASTAAGARASLGAAATVHTHAIADVTGLQTALDGKQAAGSYAAAVHTHIIADVTGLQAAIDAKAPIISPTFTGTPTAPTQPSSDNSTALATTAYVKSVVSGGGGGSVTSVNVSGGTTGLTASGGPITSSGTITLGGTLAVANGGTGASTLTGYLRGNGTGAFTASSTIPSSAISGLGTAASYSIGTSGGSVPLLNAANTWTGEQTFSTGGIVLAANTSISAGNSTARILLGNPTTATAARLVVGAITAANTTTSTEVSGIELVTNSTQTRYHVVFNNGSVCGSISTNTSGTQYNSPSDYRLKENIAPISNAVDRVKQLDPVRFTWKQHPSAAAVDGFIAHEVQGVVPEAITGDKDAIDADGNPIYQGIDQSKLVPLLTAALKETIAKVDALEQRISQLEAAA